MRYIRFLLTLTALLLWGASTKAQYNPADPPEPGVYFTLTTNCTPEDGGSVNVTSGTYAFGSSVWLQAYPSTGFRFTGWVDSNGNTISTENPYTYLMPVADVHLTARFVYDPANPEEPPVLDPTVYSTVTLLCNPEDAGVFEGNGRHIVGENIWVRAYPTTGFIFENWTKDGEIVSTDEHFIYTVEKGNPKFVANFRYNPDAPAEPGEPHVMHNLKLQNSLPGASSLYGEGRYEEGSTIGIQTYGNEYFTFVNWTDETGNIISSNTNFNYVMPDRNVTLTANYTYYYDPASPSEPGTPDIPTVAPNTVVRPRFTMRGDDHVVIMCETDNAEIHYTIDGTDPTQESTLYTEPFFVGSNLEVRAIAYVDGMYRSPMGIYRVASYKAAKPEFVFANFKIGITCATEGAVIRYTTDFSDPTEESEVYTAPFTPEDNCRVKAIASKEGLADSPIAMFAYRKSDYMLPAPVLSLDGTTLTMTCSVEGAEIRYTTDGSDPTVESTLYSAPVTATNNTVYRAIAVRENYYDSSITELRTGVVSIETPVISYAAKSITITCATEEAEIRYTLDGSEPTAESTPYTEPIAVSADCTVKAKGFYEEISSATASYTFTLATYTEAQAGVEMKYHDRQIIFSHEVASMPLRITTTSTGGETRNYSGTAPYFLEVESDLAKVSVVTATERPDMFNAAAVERDVNVVAKPVFDHSNPALLAISTSTSDATIHYTSDGSDPTSTSTIYSAPIAVEDNTRYKAIAIKDNWFDSDIASYLVSDVYMDAPGIEFRSQKIRMWTENGTEQIRYTLDGTDPTEQSTLYTEPFLPENDCTVKARAFANGKVPSDITTFNYTRATYTVATPAITRNTDNNTIVITCSTPDAVIMYADDSMTDFAAYTAPIAITRNGTWRAYATHNDMLTSETASFSVGNMKVPSPKAQYAAHTLRLTCEDRAAQILYTFEAAPATPDQVYTAPIALTGDATVRFLARRDGYNDSDIERYEFTIASYVVEQPVLTPNYRERLVRIVTPDDSETLIAKIHNIGSEEPREVVINTTLNFGVDPSMSAMEVEVRPSNPDKYYPEAVTLPLAFHEMPEVMFDGRHLSIEEAEGDDNAEIEVEFNGNVNTLTGATNEMIVEELGRINARTLSDHKFFSDTISMPIVAWFNGEEAATSEASVLERAFEWCGYDGVGERLKVSGIVDGYDLMLLNEITKNASLRHLDLTDVNIPERVSSTFFNDSRLISIYLPSATTEYGSELFSNAKEICAAVWQEENPIVGRAFSGINNPNFLIFAPTEKTDSTGNALNIVADGRIRSLDLTDGYPFYPLMDFVAEKIEFTHDFEQKTLPGDARGWETIALPFSPDEFIHESKGRILPFASEEEGDLRFWLHIINDDCTFTKAAGIEAYTPYIISMPNNEEYIDRYNLNGKVTFRASEATVASLPDQRDRNAACNFGNLEYNPAYYFLNVETEVDGYAPGSVFVSGEESLLAGPFQVYLTNVPLTHSRHYLISQGMSGVDDVTADSLSSDGIDVYQEADEIWIISARNREVSITDMTGKVIRRLSLKAGEKTSAGSYVPGVYLIAGRKIMVR